MSARCRGPRLGRLQRYYPAPSRHVTIQLLTVSFPMKMAPFACGTSVEVWCGTCALTIGNASTRSLFAVRSISTHFPLSSCDSHACLLLWSYRRLRVQRVV